ncbi:heavy metal translocating P-type ATPase [Fundidesulfovibrio terrae]|uniref:heavy metal translocating P-type ATPase n=1 Tax=Fundidesulfovibrio terrae TaxID=2922866 RepID=UPI001FAFFB73|nr:heavy metal translocating P-type ATPase [Fundidesulfovibrio terrae]
MEKLTMPVKGMHCASCSSRIERTVGKMEGVESVAVNLAAETMDVSFDPSIVTLDGITARVAELGFTAVPPAPAGIVRLAIGGMHCASCSRRIETVVGGMEGVAAMRVNLATETGELELAPGGPALDVVIGRIAGLGFTASPLAGDDESLFEAQQRDAAERLEMRRKALGPQLTLGGLVLLIAMGPMLGLPLPAFLSPDTSPAVYALTQLALTLPLLWLGRRFYLDGVPALLRGGPNMDSLIALGTGAAFLASLWTTLEIVLGHGAAHNAHGLYYESAAVIIALISLGKYFEARSKSQTTEAVKSLLSLAPDTATLVGPDGAKSVAVKLVRPGDMLLVRPGERVPVDGVVVEGASEVDESMLTGESVPVAKNPGDPLASGTLNALGALTMRAERVGADTVLARIIRLVRDAQGSKAPIASLADRVSLYFVPVVMALAVLAALAWLWAGEGWGFALRIFVSVMVIACPCAMGLATPTSIMVGTGRGARLGVLIKSGRALETASAVNAVVLDKTGTLTLGKPLLTDVLPAPGADSSRLLASAAAVEALSAHPLGQAVVQGASARGLALPGASDASAVPGQGVSGMVSDAGLGQRVLVGRSSWLAAEGTAVPPELEAQGAELSAAGKTPLFVAEGARMLGVLAVADAVRPEAAQVVGELGLMGVRVVMLTGDNPRTARAVADQAGVTEVLAEVPPEGKAEKVRALKDEGLTVAMVGDGINDAPALAVADVGISMGTGIDVAIEAGDVVLMRGDLRGVLTAIRLSKATVRNIKENLFWAFAYNVLGIPVAAGVLHAFGGPTLSPMIAGAAMAMSSVSVVSNALRLRFFKG